MMMVILLRMTSDAVHYHDNILGQRHVVAARNCCLIVLLWRCRTRQEISATDPAMLQVCCTDVSSSPFLQLVVELAAKSGLAPALVDEFIQQYVVAVVRGFASRVHPRHASLWVVLDFEIVPPSFTSHIYPTMRHRGSSVISLSFPSRVYPAMRSRGSFVIRDRPSVTRCHYLDVRWCVALYRVLGQCTDVWNDGASGQHIFIPWLPIFITNHIGSHLVEVTARFAGDRTYAAIFDAVMAGVTSFALDRSANFVVQSVLASVHTEQQRLQAVQALRPMLQSLFERVRRR